jgi:hypothetical protein
MRLWQCKIVQDAGIGLRHIITGILQKRLLIKVCQYDKENLVSSILSDILS